MKRKIKIKEKRMLNCRVGVEKKKKKKEVQLGREVGEERGEKGGMNKGGSFRNVKCCISKNGITNNI